MRGVKAIDAVRVVKNKFHPEALLPDAFSGERRSQGS
jgi:hypothetical protein